MPRVVITHDVIDIGRWLKGKAERAAAIGSAGTNVTDYAALDGSNHVQAGMGTTLAGILDRAA